MTNVAKVADLGDGVTGIRWWCPGCESMHVVPVTGPQAWGFNGSLTAPTLTPSVLVNGRRGPSSPEWEAANPRCHVYVTDGRIHFLDDCEHHLHGQTVPMRPEGGE